MTANSIKTKKKIILIEDVFIDDDLSANEG
jgi:hypothetical protein